MRPAFSQEYLLNFWPELQAAQDLYCSVSQALQEKESEGTEREYLEHLPSEVLEAGIKSGRYIQVGKPTNKFLQKNLKNWTPHIAAKSNEPKPS